MNLPTIPGYVSIAPLDKEKHREVGVKRAWPYASTLHAVYLSGAEFFLACKHYPIVFSPDPGGSGFTPVAITGFQGGENLFVDGDGKWIPDVYVPAVVRQYPFCLFDVRRTEGAPPEQLICVDEAALDESEPALFDAEGKPTEAWERDQKFLKDIQIAREQTTRMMRAIEQEKLIEPFAAEFLPEGASSHRLDGMHRVDESKLNKLGAKALRGFMSRGELSRMYAHLISLDNFRLLLDRFAARNRASDITEQIT